VTTALDFAFLDDLALAVARGRVDALPHLAVSRVDRLGPLVELMNLQRMEAIQSDSLDVLRPSEVVRGLQGALSGSRLGHGVYVSPNRSHVGFIATSRDPDREDQTEWVKFCRHGQEAAEFASLPKQQAQALIGAVREIEENVHLHSGRAHDGIVCFRANENEFEFVVADSGMGVLNSLRQAPEHAALTDAGTAIRLALTDGHSRFGRGSGHGYGFHGLFVGLANLDGELRFRSDDHALTIDGASPTLMTAHLSQKVPLRGFVVSVLCRGSPGAVSH